MLSCRMFTIIGGDGKEYGPVSVEQVRLWLIAGRASLVTRARKSGEEAWRPLGDFAEFSPYASPEPPPLEESVMPTGPIDAKAYADALIARAAPLDPLECFDRSWRLLKANFWPLVGMTLLVILTSWVLSTLAGHLPRPRFYFGEIQVFGPENLVNLFLGTAFTGGRQGGTTVAGAVLTELDREPYWLVFNVGDSRVYRLTDAGLEQVSVDHSVAQELAEAGVIRRDQVAGHPDRHVLTRALGTGEPPEPDYWLLPAGHRDRLLMCTDGLVRELADEYLERVLARCPDAQEAADRLVGDAVARGGRDNVSVVVVDVAPIPALAGESGSTAQRGWL